MVPIEYVGPRAGLNGSGEEKISYPCWDSQSGAIEPVAIRYTDCAIPVTDSINTVWLIL
jgi:hypothetical protein